MHKHKGGMGLAGHNIHVGLPQFYHLIALSESIRTARTRSSVQPEGKTSDITRQMYKPYINKITLPKAIKRCHGNFIKIL